MLERLFRSKAEVRVLGVVLFSDGLHLREIARAAGVSSFEAKRELDSLEALGVLVSRRQGNLRVYSRNLASPLLADLTSLYSKTEGVAAVLSKSVGGLRDSRGEAVAEYAFVFGSFARGEFRERSDVDVLVVAKSVGGKATGGGSAGEDELAAAFLKAQKKTGRAVNFVLWSERDFEKKLAERGSFVKTVCGGKRVWLAGDENGFKRVVEKTLG